MQNYFNYFTEIEEHYQRRRGSILLLSTLDWALIESWREAGIPLAAVLRGIDQAFDKLEARKQKRISARINSLAWCAPAVMAAVEEMMEAATGAAREQQPEEDGFAPTRIAEHLRSAAEALLRCPIAQPVCQSIAAQLQEQASAAGSTPAQELEVRLTALEDKLFSCLLAETDEALLIAWKQQAVRDLAQHRSRMHAAQMQLVQRQYLHKRLIEEYGLQRLSLFYMRQTG